MKRPVIVESNGGPRHCDAGLVRVFMSGGWYQREVSVMYRAHHDAEALESVVACDFCIVA